MLGVTVLFGLLTTTILTEEWSFGWTRTWWTKTGFVHAGTIPTTRTKDTWGVDGGKGKIKDVGAFGDGCDTAGVGVVEWTADLLISEWATRNGTRVGVQLTITGCALEW